MHKSRGTDGSLLRSLPWTLAAMALSFAPHVPFVPFWITGILILSGIWRMYVERRRGVLPHPLARGGIALACFLGVFITYDTISGVGPGSALLAVMAAMKLLETRQRRDQFVLLFISIFLTMSALLREQYLWSLPFLLASLLLILTAWLRMAASDTSGIRQSAAVGGRMLLYAAPVAAAMWILFPRIATPFWSVPIDTGSAVTGLSDEMSPGDISSLSKSNAVAFRVRFEGGVPDQNQLYWRALVLPMFNGRSWSLLPDWDTGISSRALDQIDAFGEPIIYDLTLEPTRRRFAVALDLPYQWDLQDSHMGRHYQILREYPIDQRVAYRAVSFPQYRAGSGEIPRGRFLEVPGNSNPRTAELARQIRAEAGSDSAFIEAVLDRFSSESYYYTLEPPALGRNPVDQFLFETQQGFCEHYASAFAVMMRAAGIPSRIVLGYQGGEMNDDYMIVRQADAHAWAEVWLPGVGWRRVDPTAAVAPERVESGRAAAVFDGIGEAWGMSRPSAFIYEVALTWDSINAAWNEWVLGYGPDQQESFMEWLGMENPGWRKLMLTLVALVALQVFGISMLMIYRNRPPRRDRAARLYARFIRKTGLTPATGETPNAFARRAATESGMDAKAIEAVTRAYIATRYGPPAPGQIERLAAAIASA